MPSNFNQIKMHNCLALAIFLSVSFAAQAQDPIDRSIIFIAGSYGYMKFDDAKQFEDRTIGGISLGLHLNRTWSTSLFYSRSHPESQLGRNYRYENYFVQIKRYWREHSPWRPYLTAGLGEAILDRENDSANTTGHVGVGMHYAINKKWAGQLDYRYFSALHESFQEQSLMTSIVYRFGKGER